MAGVGAGVDSYYEYLLKAHTLFGRPDHLAMSARHSRRLAMSARHSRRLAE